MIGLIDGDTYFTNKSMYLPNLELMKLYSYYKERGEIIKLIEHPQEEYHKCSTVYLRAQHSHTPILDDLYYQHDDIHIGGSFFTKRKYVPFKNIQIEAAAPSYRLYTDFIKQIKPTKHFSPYGFTEYNYLRFNSPAPYNDGHFNLKKNIYVYDEDLLTTGNIQRLPELMKYQPHYIGFNHAFLITSQHDFDLFKQVYNDLGARIFQRSMTRLRLYWPRTFMGVKTLYQQYKTFFDTLGTNAIQIPLILDNFQKIQYNIIEGIKKYAFIASQYKHPLLWYVNDENNEYNDLCNYFVNNHWRNKDKTNIDLIRVAPQHIGHPKEVQLAKQLIELDDHVEQLMGRTIIQLRECKVI